MKTWCGHSSHKAEEELQQDHESGLLTDKEYRQAMRELHQEYDECAREDAQGTYDSWYY